MGLEQMRVHHRVIAGVRARLELLAPHLPRKLVKETEKLETQDEVNRIIEDTAWGSYHTEFHPTYDYKAVGIANHEKAK